MTRAVHRWAVHRWAVHRLAVFRSQLRLRHWRRVVARAQASERTLWT